MNENLDKFESAYSQEFNYSLDNELMMKWYPERILAGNTQESILELGIGHGYTTLFFSENSKRHVVIEGSNSIIKEFKKRNKDCKSELIETYFENFTTEEKFDLIVMGFILEHVDDPYEILNKFKSFLKPEGSIFIAVPNSKALNRRFGFEAGLLSDYNILGDADLQLGHKRWFDIENLSDLVQSAGLKVIRKEGLFLKPITTNQIKKLELDSKILDAMMKVGIDYPELCNSILLEVKNEQ